MVSTIQQAINHVVIGALAVILLGGTLALLILGKDVPQYWQNFDGMVIVAAFANGAFFVQARTALPVANALMQSLTQYHELAATAQGTKSMTTGTGMSHTGENGDTK